MDWRIKGCIQGVLARLPAGASINDALQTLLGGRADEGRHIDSKVRDDWLVLMETLRGLGYSVHDRDVMEIGTGWLPVLPLCFALAGARQVHTFDLHAHLRVQAIPNLLRHLERHLGALAQACGQPESEIRERHARLTAAGDGEQVLERAGIIYHAPADAAATGLADGAVGLVFSNSVLEHVPAAVLDPLMRETKRVLAADGLALHSVNCADHYAYFDRSITPIHYLRFDTRQWSRWNNDILFQNRLRPVDFARAAQQAGLTLVHEMRTVRPELLAAIDKIPIAQEFGHYCAEELCATSVTFAARPAPSRTD